MIAKYSKDGRSYHKPKNLKKIEMSYDLELACCDLQYEMLWASKAMEIDDILIGANSAFIKGFWTGWNKRQEIINGIGEIFDQSLGK